MSQLPDQALLELQRRFPAALDYLTSIFLLTREYGEASNTRLASRLGVSKSAVSQAIGRLRKHKLADQDLYGTIRLTAEGRLFAVGILKRHYLIEHLLIRKAGYPWDRSDDEAQRLQTAISQELTDHLYEVFERPDTCPHGNPFPGSPREAALIRAPRVNTAGEGARITLIRITEEGEMVDGLLKFCDRHKLHPGRELTVRHRSDEGDIEVSCCDGTDFVIPAPIARHLCYSV